MALRVRQPVFRDQDHQHLCGAVVDHICVYSSRAERTAFRSTEKLSSRFSNLDLFGACEMPPELSKREVLNNATFGSTVAEEEEDTLQSYFVETHEWRRVLAGEVDIIRGPKGSGKSAIYSLLQSKRAVDALFDRGIIVLTAENPRGAVAFKDLVKNPPADENEFRELWKLYFLALIGRALREFDSSQEQAKLVINHLEAAGLIPRGSSLGGYLLTALDYVRSWISSRSLEPHLNVGPDGTVALVPKIVFREPTGSERLKGLVSVDGLFQLANDALERSNYSVWLLLDRLDVAFADSPKLERRALRSLFQVYRDLSGFRNIKLKIFCALTFGERSREMV
jgi:hypothetical protein